MIWIPEISSTKSIVALLAVLYTSVTLPASIWQTSGCREDLLIFSSTTRGSFLSYLHRIGMDILFIISGTIIAHKAYENMDHGEVSFSKHVRVELTKRIMRAYSVLLPLAFVYVALLGNWKETLLSLFFLNNIFTSETHALSTELLPVTATIQMALLLPILIASAEILADAKFVQLRSVVSFTLRVLGVKFAFSLAKKLLRYNSVRRLTYAALRRIQSKNGSTIPAELILSLQFFFAVYVTERAQEYTTFVTTAQDTADELLVTPYENGTEFFSGVVSTYFAQVSAYFSPMSVPSSTPTSIHTRFPISAFLAGAILGKCIFEKFEFEHHEADVVILAEAVIVLVAAWLDLYSVAATQILIATILFISIQRSGQIGRAVSSFLSSPSLQIFSSKTFCLFMVGAVSNALMASGALSHIFSSGCPTTFMRVVTMISFSPLAAGLCWILHNYIETPKSVSYIVFHQHKHSE